MERSRVRVVRCWAAMVIAALVPFAAFATDAAVRAAIREEMLSRINADRRVAGLRPVALDDQLTASANAYCERQLAERTVGHFATDGLAPYVRYSQAGARDGVFENAVAWSAPYPFAHPAALDLARRSHAAMMAEEPPHDSHRRVILDPWATHVAVGSAWSGGEFRLVQIFIRRYIDWTDAPPRSARLGDRVRASGRAAAGWEIAGASIHHEPLPGRLSRERANGIESYSMPPPAREFAPRRTASRLPAEKRTLSHWAAAGGTTGELLTSGEGRFSFAAPLDRGPGIYTLVLWVRGRGSATPIAAANISTIVPAPDAGGTNDALAGR
ncbi:MAG TPA: CAP domain-containing protein [Thermoanaerobaculia bacterium]